MLPLKIRIARPNEKNFFTDCWIKNMRSKEPYKFMDYKLLSREYFPIIQTLLDEGCTVVCTHEDEDDEIFSFVNFKPMPDFQVVNFVYTKKPYRKLGIAKYLLEKTVEQQDGPIFFTHFDWFGHRMRKKGWIFNPFILWK